jgi:hypothetical protein
LTIISFIQSKVNKKSYSRPTSLIGPSKYSPSYRNSVIHTGDQPLTNYVRIKRNNAPITGIWNIDTTLHVPPHLLVQFKDKTEARHHLHLWSVKQAINAVVNVVGDGKEVALITCSTLGKVNLQLVSCRLGSEIMEHMDGGDGFQLAPFIQDHHHHPTYSILISFYLISFRSLYLIFFTPYCTSSRAPLFLFPLHSTDLTLIYFSPHLHGIPHSHSHVLIHFTYRTNPPSVLFPSSVGEPSSPSKSPAHTTASSKHIPVPARSTFRTKSPSGFRRFTRKTTSRGISLGR